MKNLENYSVQELNASEVISIDGGLFGFDDLAALAIGIVIAGTVEIMGDWDHFKNGLGI